MLFRSDPGGIVRRRDSPAVGAEGDTQNRPQFTLERLSNAAGIDFADLGPPRRTADCDVTGVGAERDASNPSRAGSVLPIHIAGNGIPHAEIPVPTPRDDGVPVEAERRAADVIRVAPQDMKRFAARHIPNDRSLIGAGRDQVCTVLVEPYTVCPLFVAAKGSLELTGGNIPMVDPAKASGD